MSSARNRLNRIIECSTIFQLSRLAETLRVGSENTLFKRPIWHESDVCDIPSELLLLPLLAGSCHLYQLPVSDISTIVVTRLRLPLHAGADVSQARLAPGTSDRCQPAAGYKMLAFELEILFFFNNLDFAAVSMVETARNLITARLCARLRLGLRRVALG